MEMPVEPQPSVSTWHSRPRGSVGVVGWEDVQVDYKVQRAMTNTTFERKDKAARSVFEAWEEFILTTQPGNRTIQEYCRAPKNVINLLLGAMYAGTGSWLGDRQANGKPFEPGTLRNRRDTLFYAINQFRSVGDLIGVKDPAFNGRDSCFKALEGVVATARRDPTLVGYGTGGKKARLLTFDEEARMDRAVNLRRALHLRLMAYKAFAINYGWRGGEAPNVVRSQLTFGTDEAGRQYVEYDPARVKNLADHLCGQIKTADVQPRRMYQLDDENECSYFAVVDRFIGGFPVGSTGALFCYSYEEVGGAPHQNADGTFAIYNPHRKIGKNTLSGSFRELAKIAGIEDVATLTAHCGRRTCGTRVAVETAGLMSAAAQRAATGHTSAAGFAIYEAPTSTVQAMRSAALARRRFGGAGNRAVWWPRLRAASCAGRYEPARVGALFVLVASFGDAAVVGRGPDPAARVGVLAFARVLPVGNWAPGEPAVKERRRKKGSKA